MTGDKYAVAQGEAGWSVVSDAVDHEDGVETGRIKILGVEYVQLSLGDHGTMTIEAPKPAVADEAPEKKKTKPEKSDPVP